MKNNGESKRPGFWDAWNETPAMEAPAWERLEDIMAGAGQLAEGDRVPFETLVTGDFLPAENG